ncbi:calponin homology domain-containing protein [Cokeromyces recurvatus]|uniref:calponin homology domain-containing protein n=1 Tax=Cokeromyces recurvatus TaxID=90255 RepID=UPI0022204331|nr:calponin homology domain-containing protein [Cokeromyces recurvatus]KAI7907789.1 calponin homology domain-containing protein [Cokeromyces recurvatus]
MMAESRTELLSWLNDLLRLNYTKVEQAGTGAAYCQIMDSIFYDVHMSKVKYETKHEYENISNFKILQHTFDKHKIDKIIPVDKLIKCKFQDNLEFMQWMKRFWDLHYQGEEVYDALQRRKGGNKTKSPSGMIHSTATNTIKTRKTVNHNPVRNITNHTAATGRLSSAKGAHNGHTMDKNPNTAIQDLNRQIMALKTTVDGLETERDFYFRKLRDIEILVQEYVEISHHEYSDSLRQIQHILYQTEDGFEVPPEGEEVHNDDDDDETF